jgi:hypothetical protein
MNYGYTPLGSAPALQLEIPDEPDRMCIQLYQDAAGAVVLRDRDLLEVGSGRGGGASWRSDGSLSKDRSSPAPQTRTFSIGSGDGTRTLTARLSLAGAAPQAPVLTCGA